MDLVRWVGQGGAALLDLALPLQCAGCQAVGSPWCRGCAEGLAQLCRSPGLLEPRSGDSGLPVVYAASYGGVVQAAVVAFKDGDRRDLAPVLAGALAGALAPYLRAVGALAVVPVPSSPAARRRRGDAPMQLLARQAVATLSPRPRLVPALRVTGRVADQAGLGRAERIANLRGAFVARPRAVAGLGSIPVVLVDDVHTTGATLAESVRALQAAGVTVLGGAVVAATRAGGRSSRAPPPAWHRPGLPTSLRSGRTAEEVSSRGHRGDRPSHPGFRPVPGASAGPARQGVADCPQGVPGRRRGHPRAGHPQVCLRRTHMP